MYYNDFVIILAAKIVLVNCAIESNKELQIYERLPIEKERGCLKIRGSPEKERTANNGSRLCTRVGCRHII